MNITLNELLFIRDLSSRTYTGQSLTKNGVCTPTEKLQFNAFKRKLDQISTSFKNSYDRDFGIFEVAKNRNPLNIQSRMLPVWSGIFKGANKKQFAAQVSFVVSPLEPCLDVGFYFGVGDARDLTPVERTSLKARLVQLGVLLSNEILRSPSLRKSFEDALEFGFRAYVDNVRTTSDQWLTRITTSPADCKIIFKLHPNKNGIIEQDQMAMCVDMVISLMDAIPDATVNNLPARERRTKPLSPDEWAEKAKRKKEIGNAGELYALDWERKRLRALGNPFEPIHIALQSDSFHYDIESITDTGKLIIEVKTTTIARDDSRSQFFFISHEEYNLYLNNKDNYKLYRVYDINGTPSLSVIDMATVQIGAKNYTAKIP